MKAILFDLDGTLVDSVLLHALAWQEAFARHGHHISLDVLRRTIGKGGDRVVADLIGETGAGEAIVKESGRIFHAKYLWEVRPFARVQDLVSRLKEDGWKIGIASSCKSDELEVYMRLAGISHLVEHACCGEDVQHAKPAPDIFQSALRKSGARASDSFAIGDTPFDAQAARGAQLRTIGLLSGGFPEGVLRTAGCVEVYRDPADLLARYETSPLSQRSLARARA